MNKYRLTIQATFSLIITFAAAWPACAADDMKAFPLPEPGMARFVVQLPAQVDETNFKVELIAGKTVRLDAGNRYFFAGTIEAESIQGWGYTLYRVSQLGQMAGTLMAVDPDAPKVERFVALGGEPYLIRYNSRLPIVVYAPEGVELRYRMWSADTEARRIKSG